MKIFLKLFLLNFIMLGLISTANAKPFANPIESAMKKANITNKKLAFLYKLYKV